MSSILDLINGSVGKEVIAGISKNAGTSEKETSSVISAALPAILGSMQQNASNASGAQGLLGALTGKHDGSLLDNLGGFFGAGGDEADGNGILKHVLGGNKQTLEKAISGKTGVNAASVSKIIALLAPVVMGYLGKQSKTKKVNSSDGISDLLGSLLGGGGATKPSASKSGSKASGNNAAGGDLLGGLLDQNGDGKLDAGDIGGLLGKFFK